MSRSLCAAPVGEERNATRGARRTVDAVREFMQLLRVQQPASNLEHRTVTDWDPEAFTRDLIADMRAHGGVPSQGMFAGRRLLILTTTGAKTGEARTAV